MATKMLLFEDVLKASKGDDKDKRDLYVKMGEVTFLARDIREYEVDDESEDEGKKEKVSLHAQISIPDKEKGGRLRLNFCLNSFKQFVQAHLGIPHQYLMKCPAQLAKEQVNYWMGTMPDSDLLIRARTGRKAGEDYARAVVSGSYGRVDNTPLLNMAQSIATEANMKVFRFDMPDHSMHIKAILNDKVNMGTKSEPDDVHLGFHIGNSETGGRSVTWDIMTFRLVCTNGLIALVNGARMVSCKHSGDVDLNKLSSQIREKCNEAILKQDSLFGKMLKTKDERIADIFEEARAVWRKFGLPMKHRNHVFNLLTDKYGGGTKWDLVNAITECAQALSDNPDARATMEEAAGKYMLMDQPLLYMAAAEK